MNRQSRLLGKEWDEVGHDGGTEDSAWRGATRWGDFDVVEGAASGGRWERLRAGSLSPDEEKALPLARRIARRLFRDGLMSMVFVVGLLLTGLVAGLIGPH